MTKRPSIASSPSTSGPASLSAQAEAARPGREVRRTDPLVVVRVDLERTVVGDDPGQPAGGDEADRVGRGRSLTPGLANVAGHVLEQACRR